jgi:hypothetical protein
VKNEAKMAAWGYQGKEKFYYLKCGPFKDGQAQGGVATVCIMRIDDLTTHPLYVRGVAFCNPKDQFNKKTGRTIALGRLIKAIETRNLNDPVPAKTPAGVLTRVFLWLWMSEWGATLTEYEKKLFEEEHKSETDKG